MILGCDGKCYKAWGINHRPQVLLDENNEDDFFWPSDNELGDAPTESPIKEGGDHKPTNEDEKLNRWCLRECERSKFCSLGEELQLRDFSQKVYNIKRK